MRLRLKLSHKGLLLISVLFLFELVFVLVLITMLHQAEGEAQRQARSKETVAEAGNLSKLMSEALYALVRWKMLHSQTFVDEYDKTIAQIAPIYAHLDKLCLEDEGRRQRVQNMKSYSDQVVNLTSNFRRASDPDTLLLLNPRTYHLELERNYRGFQSAQKLLDDEELKVQEVKSTNETRLKKNVDLILFVALVINFLLAAAMALAFTKRISSRLAVLTDNAARFAKKETLNQPVEGSDEIANLDRDFHRMVFDLEKAEKQKQEFINMITHDLKTPLTTVLAALALIEGAAPDEDNSQRFKRARNNILRMIGLIGQLLDVQKVEAGLLSIDAGAIALAGAIEQAVDSVKDFSRDKDVTVSFQPVEVTVMADQERLVQVLVNLLSNALKFSPRSAVVTIDVTIDAKEVEVRVSDRGRGIPRAELPKIFGRFNKIGTSESEAEQRSDGLGLFICKALVEAHKGRIGVESNPGEGSTFWFTLPKAKSVDITEGGKD